MILPQGFDCLPPLLLADTLDVPEVFFVSESSHRSANSSDSDFLPAGNMQHQFPDVVALRDGTCGGGFGVDSVENFHECRAMPRFAVEGSLELVNHEIDLRHEMILTKLDRVGRALLSDQSRESSQAKGS